MDICKKGIIIAVQDILRWKKKWRIYILFLLTAFLVFLYLGKIPLYGMKNGTSNTLFLLPLLFTRCVNANGSIKVLLYFGTILLFCNAPFLDEQKPFVIYRSGRDSWWLGECFYIILSAFLYLVYITTLSVVIALPCNVGGGDWGSTLKSALYGGWETYDQILTGIPLSINLINGISPAKAMLYTFLSVWFNMIFLGLLIDCINLHVEKPWMGITAAVFFVLLDPAMNYLMNTENAYLSVFSPISWSSVENLREILGMGILSKQIVSVLAIIIIAVLIGLIKRKSGSVEVKVDI